MELYYHPDLLSGEEIQATSVGRQAVVQQLVSWLANQPDAAGVQHTVVTGPSGIGKTTLLLLVRLAVQAGDLAAAWQPVLFPQESWAVNDPADFWLETLRHLAGETADAELDRLAERLSSESAGRSLEEAAHAALLDWRRRNHRRLLLLVDNLDVLWRQMRGEGDLARLRETLTSDGSLLILATATAAGDDLAGLFHPLPLGAFSRDETGDLWQRRAARDNWSGFDAARRAAAGGLRALEYFAAGNPRLCLRIYRVLSENGARDVHRALEALLDELTPLYKARVESLPAQQRKILDHIARVTAETQEGVSPTEIACGVRLAVNTVSSQLRRLAEDGYVRMANLRGRSSCYTLSDPLFAVWRQMRFGGLPRRRLAEFTEFLKIWYGAEAEGLGAGRPEAPLRDLLGPWRLADPREALAYCGYLADSLRASSTFTASIENALRGYLKIAASGEQGEAGDTDTGPDPAAAIQLGLSAAEAGRWEETVQLLGGALSQRPDNLLARFLRGMALTDLGRDEDALNDFERVVELQPGMHACWLIRGISLLDRRHYEEALESFDRYLLFDAGSYLGWVFRAATLARLNRHEEALTSLDRALELRPDDSVSWRLLARTLGGLRRFEDALANLNRALELKPDEAESWRVRGLVLANLGRLDQALASYDRATELRPAPSPAWAERAAVLALLDRWEDAARSLERAVEMPRCEAGVWVLRGVVLAELKQYDEAVRSYNRALELAPGASPESRSAIGEYKFRTRLAQGRPDLAELEWLDLATAPARPEGWRRVVAGIAWEAARRGRLTLARQILEESETAQQLRPLGRAVQYLLTGDEALVEKLSPEVRGIVDEIVQRLRLETGCQEEPRKPPARSEAAPRTRRKAARE